MIAAGVLCLAGCSERVTIDPSKDPMTEGWQAYQFGLYEQAIAWFKAAAEKAPANSEAQAKALYALGTAQHFRRPQAEPERAMENYRKVYEMVKGTDLAAWALYSMARLDAQQKSDVQVVSKEAREKAIASYQKVIDEFPDSLAGQEAVMMQQSLRMASMEKAEVEATVARLKEFQKAYPNSPYVSSSWKILAAAYEYLHQWQDQLNALIKSLDTLERDPTNPIMVKSSVYWDIATVAEYKVGDFETAKKYQLIIQEKFPRDYLVYSSKKAVERMNQKQAELRKEASGQSQAASQP